MTKNILAIAIAAVAAPSAFAAATVYGVAHMSGNSFNSVSGNGDSTGLTSISSNSSYLGIKGSEDLSGDMKAVYQMEFGVNMDGETGTSGLGGAARNTFVGLGGGFGTVLVGRHDSLIKMTGRKYDLFGDQVGNNRNILRMSLPTSVANAGDISSFAVDGRHNNVLAYVSPTWSGFHFGLAYVPSSATTQNETYDNATLKTAALTALADYTVGNFSATLGYINIDNASSALTGLAATREAFTAYRLGAGYTFGAAKVVGLYQNAAIGGAVNAKQDTYGLGGSYKVGAAGTVKAQYYMAGNNSALANTNGTLTTVGYDHALSKNTTAYAVYSAAHNAANAGYTTDMGNTGAGSNVAAVTGKDNSAFSVGIIHKF